MVSRHKIYQDQKKLFIKYYHISMILSSNHFFLTVLKAQCAGADVLLVAPSALGDLFHLTSGNYLFNTYNMNNKPKMKTLMSDIRQ